MSESWVSIVPMLHTQMGVAGIKVGSSNMIMLIITKTIPEPLTVLRVPSSYWKTSLMKSQNDYSLTSLIEEVTGMADLHVPMRN